MAKNCELCYGAVAVIALLYIVKEADAYFSENKWPRECEGYKYCSVKPKNYNKVQEAIDLQIRESGLTATRQIQDYLFKAGQERIGGDRENCNYIKKMVKPYVAEEDSKFKLIVQSRYFEQKIQTTECATDYGNATLEYPDKQCFSAMHSNDELTFNCKTKNTAIKMYVFNLETERIESASVEIPVCCYCHIQSIYD